MPGMLRQGPRRAGVRQALFEFPRNSGVMYGQTDKILSQSLHADGRRRRVPTVDSGTRRVRHGEGQRNKGAGEAPGRCPLALLASAGRDPGEGGRGRASGRARVRGHPHGDIAGAGRAQVRIRVRQAGHSPGTHNLGGHQKSGVKIKSVPARYV